MHFDLPDTVTCASFTPAALDVKAEPSGAVASDLGVLCRSISFSDKIEKPYIRGRIGPRSPSDRRLIDTDHLIELIKACYRIALDTGLTGPVELMGQVRHKSRIDERRLTGP